MRDATNNCNVDLPIAIVGGGLGGLALAIGLLRHGINIRIYEAAASFSEIGAGVAFGVNSTRALHLIDPALLEGYKKHATFDAELDKNDRFYTLRWGTNGESRGNVAGAAFAEVNDEWHPEVAKELGVRTRSCIHRARLLEEMIALLPEGITTFHKSLKTVEELADGNLKLHFHDGSSSTASALIGCDGIKSVVRESVCPKVEPVFAREYAFRAVVPKADAKAALGANLALNGNMYCGSGKNVITYPVEHGTLINMVALPYGEDWTWDGDWTGTAKVEEFRHIFKGWYPPLVDIMQQFLLPQKWALFSVPDVKRYYKGRICLLGDSAHATVPHLGAGAGMAMEDAYMLSNLIACSKGGDDIVNAFCAFDEVRRPRTQECIRRSRDAALAYDLILSDDPSFVADHLRESFKWLWHYDIEEQLQHAKILMKDSTADVGAGV